MSKSSSQRATDDATTNLSRENAGRKREKGRGGDERSGRE